MKTLGRIRSKFHTSFLKSKQSRQRIIFLSIGTSYDCQKQLKDKKTIYI